MDNVLIDDRRIHVDFSQSVCVTYSAELAVCFCLRELNLCCLVVHFFAHAASGGKAQLPGPEAVGVILGLYGIDI